MEAQSPPSDPKAAPAEAAPPDARARRLDTWRSLATNRDFMVLWGGFTVSSLGTALSNLAIPILALAISGSPLLVGLVSAARLAPYILLNLVAGVLIDRWDRRWVMVASDLGRFGALATVPVAYALDALTIGHLAVVAFVEGVGHVFHNVAQLSALPRVVPAKHLATANGLNEVGDSVASVSGPAISGVLIAQARNSTLGAVYGYVVDAVTYLLSGVALLFVRTPLQAEREPRRERSLWGDLREGMSYLWRQRLLRLLMVMTTLVNLFQAPLYLSTIVLATDDLDVDTALVGLVFSIAGLGPIVSALASGRLHERFGLRFLTLGPVLLWAVAAALTAGAPSVALLALGLTLTNVLWPVYSVAVVSFRLSRTPDELQGRVNSAFRTLSMGVEPLGVALGGVLVSTLGPRPLLWASAAGLLVTFAVCAGVWGRAQRADAALEKAEAAAAEGVS
ncbi:MFS transporter [Streptomyces paradoxus]|uniref:MFS transporter n=1 Tax=Streptomyces paradoxus TaxID=66375 RepID=UPI00380FEECC